MVNAQEWLNSTYSDKNQVKIIEIADEAEGELIIDNFLDLKEIKKKTEGEKNITKLTITNCPCLQKVNCYFCWKIQELIITGCPQISELNCDTNMIENLELGQLTNLTRFNCSNNRLSSLNVRNNQHLSHLSCEKNKLSELDLSNNPKIVFLDANDNSLNHSPYFFTKKHKIQVKKLRENLNWGEQILAQTLEENEEKTSNLKNRLEDLKISLTEEQMALTNEQKYNQMFQKNISELEAEVDRLTRQNKKLEQDNQALHNWLLQREIKDVEKEKKGLISVFKNGLGEDDYDDLETLLEAQAEFSKNSNNYYAQKQLEKSKKTLLKNKRIRETELSKLLQLQIELISLENQIKEEKTEKLIEVPPLHK